MDTVPAVGGDLATLGAAGVLTMTALGEAALPLFWACAALGVLGLSLIAWGLTHDD